MKAELTAHRPIDLGERTTCISFMVFELFGARCRCQARIGQALGNVVRREKFKLKQLANDGTSFWIRLKHCNDHVSCRLTEI